MTHEDVIDWMEDELTSIPDDETFAWMKDAAILAQCFFCAAYHDLITKTTFYWALGKLFGKEKNTRHDLHELARFVMIELYNGAGKEIQKTIEKDPDALAVPKCPFDPTHRPRLQRVSNNGYNVRCWDCDKEDRLVHTYTVRTWKQAYKSWGCYFDEVRPLEELLAESDRR